MKTCVKCDLQMFDYDEYEIINGEPVCFDCAEALNVKRRIQMIESRWVRGRVLDADVEWLIQKVKGLQK